MENHFLKSGAGDGRSRQSAGRFPGPHALQNLGCPSHRCSGAGANSKVIFVDRGSGAGIESAAYAGGHPRWHRGQSHRGLSHRFRSHAGSPIRTSPPASISAKEAASTRHAQRPGATPPAKSITSPTKRRWTRANGFTRRATTAYFPKGFPVGVARVVRQGLSPYQEILVESPAGLEHGLEEAVLIMLEGVHQAEHTGCDATGQRARLSWGLAPPRSRPVKPKQPRSRWAPMPTGCSAALRSRSEQPQEVIEFGEGTAGDQAARLQSGLKLPPTIGAGSGCGGRTSKRPSGRRAQPRDRPGTHGTSTGLAPRPLAPSPPRSSPNQ